MCGLTPLFIVSRPKAISTHTQLHKITKFLQLFLTPPPKMKNTPITFKKKHLQKISPLPHTYKKKSHKSFDLQDFMRRERDSNPRNLSVQRFSRPPRSTTPPSLQCHLATMLSFDGCKVRYFYLTNQIFTPQNFKFFKQKNATNLLIK